MAGSYEHIVTSDGNLIHPQDFPNMIENLGDAYEAIEEMYGMIWILAYNTSDEAKVAVRKAQTNWKWGLEFAKSVNREDK